MRVKDEYSARTLAMYFDAVVKDKLFKIRGQDLHVVSEFSPERKHGFKNLHAGLQETSYDAQERRHGPP